MPSVTLSSRTGGPVAPVVCCAAYFAALQSAVLVTTSPRLLPEFVGSDPIRQGLYADICATLVVFAISYTVDNTSVYDPFWPVAPCALTAFWAHKAASASAGVLAQRQWLAVVLVWAWALRLLIGVPWCGWRQGIDREDWRYVEIRSKTGGGLRYWATSLLSLHLTPTLLVFATLRPFGVVITTSQESPTSTLTAAEACAALVCVAAIAVEGVADEQLRRFRQTDAYRAGGCYESGLWRYSRHPNYFGEVLFHVGALCYGLACGVVQPPTESPLECAPAIAMALFFRCASVPMMEQRSLSKRLDYEQVMSRVPSPLLLWPPPTTRATSAMVQKAGKVATD